jgi:hypothetical protein
MTSTRGPASQSGIGDGQYWPTVDGEAYHGYRYRILTSQGKDAPGGAKSYLDGGRMTGGYGFVAWPAKFGETGIMSFIVGKDGVV